MAYGSSLRQYTPYGMGALQYAAQRYTTSQRIRHNTGPMSISTTKRRKLSRGNSFHALAVKEMPAKHFCNSSATNLLHGTYNTVIPTAGIVQGTSNTTRIADHIQLCAIKIKGCFQSAATAAGFSYRIIVGFTGEEYNLPTVLGSGLGSTELMIANSDSNWALNGLINPKAFTVLHDSTYDINSQIAAVADISSFAMTVPLNSKFDYQANGSIYGKTKNLAVVVVGTQIGGVIGTTLTGQVILSYDLIFK